MSTVSQGRSLDGPAWPTTTPPQPPGSGTGPIELNVVTISPEFLSRKNLFESLAQFCSNVDVGSVPVLTCTV